MIKRFYYVPLFIVFITTLIIGSFSDFQINSVIYNQSNQFGIFMAAFGEYPGYFLIAFFGSYMLATAFKTFKSPKNASFFINLFAGVIAVVLSTYYQGHAIECVNGYDFKGLMKLLGYGIGLVLMIPPIVIGFISGLKSKNESFWQIALAFLLTITITIIVITVVKGILHRPRFRFLVSQSEVTFKNWWEAFPDYKSYVVGNVTSEEFKSFPSGHVGTGTMVLCMPYLPLLIKGKNSCKTFIILSIISILYPPLLAFTRMLCGAHFLSDVSVGGLIGTIVFSFFHELVFRKSKKKNIEI